MSSSFDGFAILREWQRNKNQLTLFSFGLNSFGRMDTAICGVDETPGWVALTIEGTLPAASFAVDFSGAEFEMIESAAIPVDASRVLMGVEGYERFLSVKFPNGALAIIGAKFTTHI